LPLAAGPGPSSRRLRAAVLQRTGSGSHAQSPLNLHRISRKAMVRRPARPARLRAAGPVSVRRVGPAGAGAPAARGPPFAFGGGPAVPLLLRVPARARTPPAAGVSPRERRGRGVPGL